MRSDRIELGADSQTYLSDRLGIVAARVAPRQKFDQRISSTSAAPLLGEPAGAAQDERPIGFGRLKRKEDARFIRGQGTYVDDLQLPGMLHGAVLRSPFAHARIVSIDSSVALQHPKVHCVLTGADLAARGLAWMPTMSSDTQAVLATDKVRF